MQTLLNKQYAISLLMALVTAICLNAQQLELKELNVPNSPAFTILDHSPKVIDRPGTAKTFTASIVNLINQGSGLPKNFSLEVAPYWLFKNNLTVYSYLGIDRNTKKQSNIFSNARNISVSIGSVYKDSSKSLPFSANYFAFGVRVNPVRIVRGKVTGDVITTVEAIAGKQVTMLKTVTDACLVSVADATSAEFKTCIAKGVTEARKKDQPILDLEKRLQDLLAIKPVFQLDLAFAGSFTFKDNSFDDNHHHRSGIWTTMELNVPLTDNKDIEKMIANKNYLSVYGKVRYISEDSTTNYKTFTQHKLLDFGGRIEFELDKFSISFESIHRINRTNDKLNTNRNVGILQYKIRDDLFLSGTFGKNFGNVNNLFALLGLNWGFGKQSLTE
jgi:hypothetical protein